MKAVCTVTAQVCSVLFCLLVEQVPNVRSDIVEKWVVIVIVVVVAKDPLDFIKLYSVHGMEWNKWNNGWTIH